MSKTRSKKPAAPTRKQTKVTKQHRAATALPIAPIGSLRELPITPIEYSGLQQAYDHFNRELFGGTLPDVFITYQRRAHSRGYFSADSFSSRVDKFGRHELALNPDSFVDRSDAQITSTLSHEQVHVWQWVDGKPSKGRYHNREWAAKMKEIGLQPSSTGDVGGKETGQRVSHYIIAGGAFEQAYAKLASTGWKLNLQSAHRAGAKGGVNSKTKFTCSSCGQNAWGKPDLAIICELCGSKMSAADADTPAASALIPSYDTTMPLVGGA